MHDITRKDFLHHGLRLLALPPAVIVAKAARAAASEEAAAPEPLANAKPIFDGRTFKGWEGNLDWFRIEEGSIVGGSLGKPIPQNEFLCTRESYGDFELRLQCKLLGEDPNAGVQIRSQRIPDHHEMRGYQADLGQHYWGCLYDESRRNRVLAGPDPDHVAAVLKPRDWNEYIIRCEGPRIRLWFNGENTVDYTEEEKDIEQQGLIGLQIHSGPPSEAWYKDLMLTPL